MAKKQTRRSISIRGVTYNHLRDYCAGVDLSMSDFIEQRIAEFFERNKVTVAPAAPRLTIAPPHDKRSAPLAPRPLAAASPIRPAVNPAANRAAPRVAPAPAAPRPIPASSSIVARNPMPVAALRSVPAAAPTPPPARPVASAAAASGRPAPTPAREVLKERATVPKARDSTDYRALRF